MFQRSDIQRIMKWLKTYRQILQQNTFCPTGQLVLGSHLEAKIQLQ